MEQQSVNINAGGTKTFASGWSEVNRRLRRVQATHPWECGQLLIDDVHFGLLSQRASQDLRILTKVTRHHYVQKPSFSAWRDLSRNIAKAKAVNEICTGDICWSERSAYDALEKLAAAGQHLSLGEVPDWYKNTAEAYLCTAEYFAEIAMARAAAQTTSSRAVFPAGRLRDIADSMSVMVEAEETRLKSHLDIYRSQIAGLDVFVKARDNDIEDAERACALAVQARVSAMTPARRFFWHVGQIFANGAG